MTPTIIKIYFAIVFITMLFLATSTEDSYQARIGVKLVGNYKKYIQIVTRSIYAIYALMFFLWLYLV